MMKYFMTDNQVIHEEEKLQDGVWVRMISPTQEECEEIADVLNVDIDDIKAALDEEESSRIELQDGYTLILVDVPTTEIRHDKQSYTTARHYLNAGCDRDGVHGGYAGAQEFCDQPREGVQHEKASALCVPDSVPHRDNLSDQPAHH